MDEEVLGLTCGCGAEHFVRVVIKRPMRAPYVTDFVACANCAAAYWVPAYEPTSDTLKRDAADASRDYRKPGRHKK